MNLAACPQLPTTPLTGTWFRAIQPQHWLTSLQTTQTRMIPGRFNIGSAANPGFAVLYLAENPMVALFEVQALLGTPSTPGGVVAPPRQAWITINVNLQLQRIADLTDLALQQLLQVSAQELTGDWRGYQQRTPLTSITGPIGPAPTQDLGDALFAVANLEGFQTISAKLPYHRNLVLFPHKLQRGSRVEFIHPATGQRHTIP
jgi:RES domain-containing protein